MKMNKDNFWIKNTLLVVLLAAFLVQVILLVNAQGPRTIEIYKSIGQPGRWRGANFAFSKEAADFYSFLSDKIPQKTLVIIPSQTDGPESLTRNDYVEFFLWPRNVEYCEGTANECIRQAVNDNSAVLVTDVSSVPNPAEFGERLLLFNNRWGVYLPASLSPGNMQVPFHSLWEIMVSSIPPILLLAALILPGTWLARRTIPDENGLLQLAMGIGAGLSWISLTLFISLLAGFQLSAGLILALTVGLWLLAAGLTLATKNGPKIFRWELKHENLLIALAILTPIIWAFILSAGNAYSHTDEIVLWGAKGYGISAVGLQQGVTERGTLTTWYPLNLPLLIGGFLTLFGERLPESKLIFPVYFLGFISLFFSYFQKKVQPFVSLVGTLIIATVPTIFLMATMAHGNLPLTFYLIGSVLMLHTAQVKDQKFSLGYWIWGVVFLVLAAWTRPEGLHLAWAVAATAIIFYRQDLLKEKVKIVYLLGGLGLYILFWNLSAPLAYSRLGFTEGIFSLALNQILLGNLHFQEAGFILQSLWTGILNIKEWGMIGWLSISFAILLFWQTRFKASKFDIAGFGLVIVIAIFGAFVANSYTSFDFLDIGRWVNTTLMRLAFPGLMLIWMQLFRDTAQFYFPAVKES
jgi:hypothetical protein